MNRAYKMKFDDEYQALRSVIEDSNKGYKEVAAYLFPHLKVDTAYSRLKSCLNSERDERLTFGQIIAMCRFCNRYDALYHMADELGYKRPELKPIEDEQSYLLQEFIKAKNGLEKIANKLEKTFEKRI